MLLQCKSRVKSEHRGLPGSATVCIYSITLSFPVDNVNAEVKQRKVNTKSLDKPMPKCAKEKLQRARTTVETNAEMRSVSKPTSVQLAAPGPAAHVPVVPGMSTLLVPVGYQLNPASTSGAKLRMPILL